MCGIIGIIANYGVSEEIHQSLFALQHRGQDAAGIMTFDGERMHLRKDTGLVSEIFDERDIYELRGNIGIGHTRYPTSGATPQSDVQPFFINVPYTIGMAQNGNIANYNDVKEKLKVKFNRYMTSSCDAEILLHLFANEVVSQQNQKTLKPEEEIIFDAVKKTLEKVNGANSVVALLAGKGLLAFRDQNGIRPLIIAKKDGAYAFCSETGALDMLGFKVVKDVEPGEAIFIDQNLDLFSKKLMQPKPAHCMFEFVYFARPDSSIEKKSVYESRTRLGKELAEEFKKKNINVDVVIPIPDSSRIAALAFANEIGKPYVEGMIKNRYIYRTFIMMTQSQRDNAMKLKMNPIINEVKGKKVVLVDDSLVRGTTSKQLVKLVRDAGAKEVHFLLTCPPIKHPCFYGIDMQSRGELMASRIDSHDEIAKALGADSVTYQTIEGLEKAVDLPLCKACLDGNYPTGIGDKQIRELEKIRVKEHEDIMAKH